MTTLGKNQNFAKLSAEQKLYIQKSIGSFGSGEHPPADDEYLPGFTTAYAVKCLNKAIKAGIEAPLQEVVDILKA